MATAICSHCGEVTSAEGALCVHCGLKLRQPECRDSETPVTCPECGKPTELLWLASIQVDVCPTCKGVWFHSSQAIPRRCTTEDTEAGKEEKFRIQDPEPLFLFSVAVSSVLSALRAGGRRPKPTAADPLISHRKQTVRCVR